MSSDIENEIWKPINKCEGYYDISSLGRIRNVKKDIIMKTHDNGHGYLVVGIGGKGFRKTKSVHRIVAETFIPNVDNKEQVNHIDGDKSNNCVSNLEWVNQSENIRHAMNIGLIAPIDGFPKNCFPAKRVLDTKTGRVWESARKAANDLSIKYSTIKSWLSGDRKNKSNLKYI